jgi:Tfp pilus assembly protein PilF
MLFSGQLKLAQGKIADATVDLERMVKDYPGVPRVYYQLAVVYLAGNETDQAVKSLNKALALDPNFPEAIILQAGLQIKTGNVETTIASLKQLIQQQPQIMQAQLLLADAYRARGNFDDALWIYHQLKASYPKNFEIPLLMGGTFLQQTNNGEARKAFARVLELAPDNFTALEQLVNLDLKDKQYAAALQRVQSQLGKNPKLAAPLLLEAQIFLAQGDTKQAEAALLKAVELQSDSETPFSILS